MSGEQLVTIRRCGPVWEAEMLRDRLEAAGIRAFVQGAETGRSLSYVGVALGGVKVQVAVDDVAAAEQVLLEDERQRATAGRWRCPRCDEINEPAFDVCWSCAMPREEALAIEGESVAEPEGPADERAAGVPGDVFATPQERPRETANPYQVSGPFRSTVEEQEGRNGLGVVGLLTLLILAAVILYLLLLLTPRAAAAEPPAEVASLTAAQRLALEQIDQLIAADAVDEVVPLVVRTIDEAEGRMVATEPAEELEAEFVRYVPLQLFLQDRLLRWGQSHPAVLARYRERTDAAARTRLDAARSSRSLEQATRTADAIFATSYGDEALLLVADLALERGWNWTAIGALRRIDARWQACDTGERASEVAAVGWEMWLPRIAEADLEAHAAVVGERVEQPGGWPLGCYHGSDLPHPEIGLRLVDAYLRAGERQTAERLAALVGEWFPEEPVVLGGARLPLVDALERLLEAPAAVSPRASDPLGQQWPTVGGDATRVYQSEPLVDVPMLPTWTRRIGEEEAEQRAAAVLERRLLPTEPPIGDLANLPATALPIIHRSLVLLPSRNAIHAYDLASGRSWPAAAVPSAALPAEQPSAAAEPSEAFEVAASPIFRDTEGVDAAVRAAQLPLDGEPRFTLSAAEGRVAGRFGPPESGWLAVARPRQPQSQVVLVDLEREGQLVDGYPLRAAEVAAAGGQAAPGGAESTNFEFEGAPLVVGRRMFVGVAERDDATLTSSVLCIDVASGEPLYRTPIIGSARPIVSEPRNRIGQCLVSYREGIVYYHGDSGAVAGIDSESGALRWVMRYPRGELLSGGYPRRRRSERIQLSGTAVLGPLAIVSAADCDSLFAVDPLDGRLLWALPPGEADDVDQILGQVDGAVLAGGDSLHWIARESGRRLASWPAGVSRQPRGGLPRPRRTGRALLAGREVYWPTADAIWVFDAGLAPPADRLAPPTNRLAPPTDRLAPLVRPLRRIDLRAAGLRGGHLAAAGGVLVMASADTLSAFVGRIAYTGSP
ncbi:outer membrane protein assembly factor BamB family protein [Candidatus Laterigemmans baculatus]|uniref:outer membrane protein assembly factor BamB family protein n=1 Tax=Candidatus Laterigemmans baculatus TaxID=2770505 RepID=UPI0013D96490|nr:DUF2007 domain-containing protein [Candidatus Laterigemmans baculatus]